MAEVIYLLPLVDTFHDHPQARAVGGLFKCQQAHDGLNEGSINEDIALELEKLGEKYKGDLHKNSFSTNSYFKAASKLRGSYTFLSSGHCLELIR